jgi:hypothetical protein
MFSAIGPGFSFLVYLSQVGMYPKGMDTHPPRLTLQVADLHVNS